MRVALNLVYLVPRATGGMETYARELIPRLGALAQLDLVALVNREASGEDFGCEQVTVPVRATNRVDWVRGEQQYVPRLAREAGADLIHNLASTGPIHGAVPRVTTIHDLNYKLVPETHFGLRGLGMRILVPAAARASRRIVVDAESTRRDLVDHLGTPSAKVDVVPLAASPPAVAPSPEADLRAGLGLRDRRVVLSPSAKRPHKNLERMIAALARIEPPDRPLLVIPGYPTPHECELRAAAAALGVAEDVVLPEWLSPAQLEGLYAIAECVVFPSLYEGFGLPVLEAMVRGVAVACSERSSLPEVAGGAALLFDPEDIGAIEAAMSRLLRDTSLRKQLAVAGRRQAARFTWDRTAQLTAASYERALRAPLPRAP